MLQSKYYTEHDLFSFGFKKIGKNIKISEDARIYGAENISLGNNIRIDDFTILSAVNGFIDISDNVFIARNCHLSGKFGITINDFSSMAANTVIYSSSDDYSGRYMTAQAIPQRYTNQIGGPVTIGRHVIIGAATTIIGGVKIGVGCSVGAMSLIIKDLEEWGMYAGIPVRRLKERRKELLELEKQFLDESQK